MTVKISIIVPAYNMENYIIETLESIFAQTYKAYEIIIIDDGSTDNTRKCLEPYIHKIKYIYQKNRGLAAARNTGIKHAKGEYIAFLDADDLWLPNKIEEQIKIFNNKNDISVVYSDTKYLIGDKVSAKLWSRDFRPHDGLIYENLITKGNFIPVLTAVVKKNIFKKVGFFDETLKSVEDYDLWLRIAKAGFRFFSIKKPLAIYRIRKGSLTQNDEKISHSLIRVYNKNLKTAEVKEKKELKKKINFYKINYLSLQYEKAKKENNRVKAFISCFKLIPLKRSIKSLIKPVICLVRPSLLGFKKPITVFLVRHAYAYGGAEKYNYVIAKILKEKGINCIVGTNVQELINDCKKAGVKTVNPWWLGQAGFGKKGTLKHVILSPFIFLQYVYYILRFKINIANIQTRDDQIILTLAMKLFKKPVVWTDHGDFKHITEIDSKFFWFFYEQALSLVDKIIFVCKEEIRILCEHDNNRFPREKFIVLHTGVDTKEFKVTNKLKPLNPKNKIIIGLTARIIEQKGIRYFIEAMPSIIENNHNVEFHLAGRVDEKHLVEIPKKLGVDNKVKFIGFLDSNQKIARFLEGIDIFVFPSLDEVFPISVVEAMAMGKIVLATDVGGVRELVDGTNGVLIKKGSREAIEKAVLDIIKSPKKAQQFSQRALQTVQRKFNMDTIISNEVIPMYKNLIHGVEHSKIPINKV